MGSTITHVANASHRPVHVLYSKDEVKLKEAMLKANTKGKGSAKIGFTSSDRVTYERIPGKTFSKFIDRGDLFFTVAAENDDGSQTLVCENKRIPNNRSFIVSKHHNFKWQKYGKNIWMDEQGNVH